MLLKATGSVRPSWAPVAAAAAAVVNGVNVEPFKLVPDVTAALLLLVVAVKGVLSELPLKRRGAGEVGVVVVREGVCCCCVCPGSCRCDTTR